MDKHQEGMVHKSRLSLKRRNHPKLKKDHVPQEKETIVQPNNERHFEVVSDDTVNETKRIKMEEVVDDDFKSQTINIKKLIRTKGKEK